MGLPKWWWDEVLGGQACEVDLRNTPYKNLTALRSACYREADMRNRLAVTSKRGIWNLVVQAWGNPDVPQLQMSEPQLASLTDVMPAPSRFAQPRVPEFQGRPAPQDQPPTTEDPVEDPEALLGPCTCGQDPRCLPSCERFS